MFGLVFYWLCQCRIFTSFQISIHFALISFSIYTVKPQAICYSLNDIPLLLCASASVSLIRIRQNGLKNDEPFEFRTSQDIAVCPYSMKRDAHAIPIIAIPFNHHWFIEPWVISACCCATVGWTVHKTNTNEHTKCMLLIQLYCLCFIRSLARLLAHSFFGGIHSIHHIFGIHSQYSHCFELSYFHLQCNRVFFFICLTFQSQLAYLLFILCCH